VIKQSLRCQAVIAVVASSVFFTALGATWLWDEDEAFFATAAAEMHRHGDWIVPTYNEELFAHKPPFMYWMMRCGFLLFGVNELGARFFSAVFGLATCLVTFHIGRRLFDERTGLWGALALATGLMWGVVSRAFSSRRRFLCMSPACSDARTNVRCRQRSTQRSGGGSLKGGPPSPPCTP
jgi:4-amino-4-deoxy-L-arabinose transferase-like glycosyltransferase